MTELPKDVERAFHTARYYLDIDHALEEIRSYMLTQAREIEVMAREICCTRNCNKCIHDTDCPGDATNGSLFIIADYRRQAESEIDNDPQI